MTRRIFILSVIALCYLIIRDWDSKPIEHLPGILVTDSPRQVNVQPSGFRIDDYQLTRKAKFEIQARVLSIEPYYTGRTADLSPIDLALGWGVMSNQAVIDQLNISQSGRWYRWKYEASPPVPEQQIISNSSNMHMIPASKPVERSLKKLRKGDIIAISGYLVDVDHESGWHWRSSMTRTDTGDGACELVYVESLSVVPSG
ncbi:MAG: hypothetical protein GY732_06695 [Gammaproteobacteria bacterium]|nr:hypothetical protein [Gammaproteobacteria bacterium]